MLYHPEVDPREKRDFDDQWESTRRRHWVFTIGGLLLAAAIGVGAWYVFPRLKRADATLTQFAGVQQTVDSLGERAKQFDAKIQDWTANQQEVRDQIAKVQQKTQSALEGMRKQARESSAALLRDVQARMDRQFQGVENRLAHLESSSDTEQTRLAALQQELSRVKSDLTAHNEQLNAVQRQLSDTNAANDRQVASIASLKEQQDTSRRDVDAISQKLAVRRVNFEVTKNHSRDLGDGVSLGVTGTDTRFRRVTGWMWVMPDRRTIWLRGQGAQEPVVFYSTKDGKKRELVITNVAKDAVTGYLLVPQDNSEAAAAAAE